MEIFLSNNAGAVGKIQTMETSSNGFELFENDTCFIFVNSVSHFKLSKKSWTIIVYNEKYEKNLDEPVAIYLGRYLALIGIIRLLKEYPYRLVLVKSSYLLGYFYDNGAIFQITEISILPDINLTPSRSSDNSSKLEKRLINEFLSLFNSIGKFYYSFVSDITNSLEFQFSKNYNNQLTLLARIDENYVWNKNMLKDYYEIITRNHTLQQFFVPIIRGFIKIKRLPPYSDDSSSGKIYKIPSCMILISRNCPLRCGTRIHCRGVDEHGYVANHVETEQIFLLGQNCFSYIIMRGSIPLFWSQTGKGKHPTFTLLKNENENKLAFFIHYNRIVEKYSKVITINLIENTGREKILYDAFNDAFIKAQDNDNDKGNSIQPVSMINYQFHTECKNQQFRNVNSLIDRIKSNLNQSGFYWYDLYNKRVMSTQLSIFRVNCVDCLDRTNLVQAEILSSHILKYVILTGISPETCDENLTETVKIIKRVWADNGDAISLAYSGTLALKSDFTRTGKRNVIGMVSDGFKSANRYFLFLFKDEFRQILIDILQGKQYSPEYISSVVEKMEKNDVNSRHKYSQIKEQSIAIDELINKNPDFINSWFIQRQSIDKNGNKINESIIYILTENSIMISIFDKEYKNIQYTEVINIKHVKEIELRNSEIPTLYIKVSSEPDNIDYTFCLICATLGSETKNLEDIKVLTESVIKIITSPFPDELPLIDFDKKDTKSDININLSSNQNTKESCMSDLIESVSISYLNDKKTIKTTNRKAASILQDNVKKCSSSNNILASHNQSEMLKFSLSKQNWTNFATFSKPNMISYTDNVE